MGLTTHQYIIFTVGPVNAAARFNVSNFWGSDSPVTGKIISFIVKREKMERTPAIATTLLVAILDIVQLPDAPEHCGSHMLTWREFHTHRLETSPVANLTIINFDFSLLSCRILASPRKLNYSSRRVVLQVTFQSNHCPSNSSCRHR